VPLQMNVTRELKERFPNVIVVGTAYSYLQDYLPHWRKRRSARMGGRVVWGE